MNLGKWIGLFSLLASLYILWQIRQLLLLVFTAVVIATALNRAARWMRNKTGMPRPLAVFISIAFFLLVFIGFFLIIVPPLVNQFEQLGATIPQAIAKLNDWIDFLEEKLPGTLVQELPPIDSDRLLQQIQPLMNRLLGEAGAFVGTTFGVALSMLLMMVLTLMMLADPKSYRQAFIHLFPSFYRRRVDGILDKCEIALGGWIIGMSINMSVIALLSSIALLVLGIPLAGAQAVLAGMLTFIPNIGPTLSVIPPMAIALLESPLKSVFVLIAYIIIQQIESNILTPYVMSQQVSVLPALVLICQLFFAQFFGFLGLLLALPLTVVGQVWIKEILVTDILDELQHNYEESMEEPLKLVEIIDRRSPPPQEASETKN